MASDFYHTDSGERRWLWPAATGLLCAGILFAARWALPLGFVAGATLGCALLGWRLRSNLYVAAAFFLFGVFCYGLRTGECPMPPARRVLLRLRLDEEMHRRNGRNRAEASLEAWRDSLGGWHTSRLRIVVRGDSTASYRAGDRLLVNGRIHPLGEAPYHAALRRRGFVGSLWLSGASVEGSGRAGSLARRLHAAASRRLERLPLDDDRRAVVSAMIAGDRRSIAPSLRGDYNRSGMAHLLAVSGLHVGIVFLGVNILLGWLALVHHGNRWRCAAVTAAVWLFAATAGLSPSAVRAATMCTLLQWTCFATMRYRPVEALFCTAFIMLCFDPGYLRDTGFQLSVTAVAGILCWGLPLLRRLGLRRGAVAWLAGAWIVGATASLATAPLVAFHFGRLPLAGALFSVPAVVLAECIVATGSLWIFLPAGWLADGAARILYWSAGAQNALAAWGASRTWAVVDWQPSAMTTAACYLFFCTLTAVLYAQDRKKTVSLRR